MTNGLVQEQRDILDVLEYASISPTLPEKQERELADRLVQFLKMECDPARVEIARDTGEIRLTSAGLVMLGVLNMYGVIILKSLTKRLAKPVPCR
jgi:hypothetical protein